MVHASMNHVKSKVENRSLRKLSLSIGDFIRYWGFRRVHGAIWTQIYLSKIPLSCTDLVERLALSKALISPALEELCRFKLIQEAQAPNRKIKLYIAVNHVHEVIQGILRTREAKMLQQITQDFSAFICSDARNHVDPEKIQSLEQMILVANTLLEFFLNQENLFRMAWGIQ